MSTTEEMTKAITDAIGRPLAGIIEDVALAASHEAMKQIIEATGDRILAARVEHRAYFLGVEAGHR